MRLPSIRPSINASVVSGGYIQLVPFDCHGAASCKVAARVGILACKLDEAVGKVAIVADRFPAVVEVVVVVHAANLLWVELDTHEGVLCALH